MDFATLPHAPAVTLDHVTWPGTLTDAGGAGDLVTGSLTIAGGRISDGWWWRSTSSA